MRLNGLGERERSKSYMLELHAGSANCGYANLGRDHGRIGGIASPAVDSPLTMGTVFLYRPVFTGFSKHFCNYIKGKGRERRGGERKGGRRKEGREERGK